MEVYLVGGAVRDELLDLAVKEHDWVVTGATPGDLLDQGYRQVGASFPVYLHPQTGEEYALARTERKQGHGYHGFEVDFHPGVTIEEDLQRRDLTINAMARDAQGTLVDPWGGQRDLEARVLRHVAPAFAEDPLRVLRVARFAARFADLGFTVHPETMDLMRSMTTSGEVDHLVPERCWAEIRDAMATSRPSVFIRVLRDCGALEVLLPEVACLYGVPQQPQWHPEVDTGEHVELALDQAAALGAGPDAVFAVLLHDLGKGLTPRDQWPAHPGHESAGLPLVDAVCQRFRVPGAVHRLARSVCRDHLKCHRLDEMRPGKVLALLEGLDAIRNPDIEAFLIACQADFTGRTGLQDRPFPQAQRLRGALAAALEVRAAAVDPGGALEGPALGEALRQARVEAIAHYLVESSE